MQTAGLFGTIQHSTKKDTLADVMKVGYFDKVFTLAATGDIIVIVTSHGTVIKVMELTEDKHIKLTSLK